MPMGKPLRRSRVQFMLVDEPMMLPLKEQRRRQRVLAKVIKMLGLSHHKDRIYLARSFIDYTLSRPQWVEDMATAAKESGASDASIELALNLPRCFLNIDFMNDEAYEPNEMSSVQTYIWLDGIFPQEKED